MVFDATHRIFSSCFNVMLNSILSSLTAIPFHYNCCVDQHLNILPCNFFIYDTKVIWHYLLIQLILSIILIAKQANSTEVLQPVDFLIQSLTQFAVIYNSLNSVFTIVIMLTWFF